MRKILKKAAGQAMTEMIFLIPLFVILAAGATSVAYMCWQGIKVQEAANLAARVAGQETVGGAKDFATMMQDNGLTTSLGVNAVGDPDPTEACQQTDPAKQQQCLEDIMNGRGGASLGTKLDADAAGSTGVYWKYRRLVYNLFSPGEQKHLYVPPPQTRGGTSEVKVTRIMKAPKVLGWQMPAVSVSATAYGGEDSYMYSLPRFGRTGGNGNELFWEKTFKGNAKLKDTSQD